MTDREFRAVKKTKMVMYGSTSKLNSTFGTICKATADKMTTAAVESRKMAAILQIIDNLVLSTELTMYIGHRKEIRKLTFRALVVCGLYTERWSYAIGWCLVT